jgi:hypothetical protein
MKRNDPPSYPVGSWPAGYQRGFNESEYSPMVIGSASHERSTHATRSDSPESQVGAENSIDFVLLGCALEFLEFRSLAFLITSIFFAHLYWHSRFRLVQFVTILSSVAVGAGEILHVHNWRLDYFDDVLRLYGVLFSMLVIANEIEFLGILPKDSLLKKWPCAGLFYCL